MKKFWIIVFTVLFIVLCASCNNTYQYNYVFETETSALNSIYKNIEVDYETSADLIKKTDISSNNSEDIYSLLTLKENGNKFFSCVIVLKKEKNKYAVERVSPFYTLEEPTTNEMSDINCFSSTIAVDNKNISFITGIFQDKKSKIDIDVENKRISQKNGVFHDIEIF